MSVAHNIKMILTLHCDESSRLLSEGMEHKLTRSERIALRLHLAICRSCSRFRRNTQLLRKLMHRLHEEPASIGTGLPPLTPPERQRIREAVHKAHDENS
jgi:hypothetical protein